MRRRIHVHILPKSSGILSNYFEADYFFSLLKFWSFIEFSNSNKTFIHQHKAQNFTRLKYSSLWMKRVESQQKLLLFRPCPNLFLVPLHNTPQTSVACLFLHSSSNKHHQPTSNEFVSQRFSLCDGAEPAGGDLLRVQLHRLLGDVEPLLDHRGQLADPTALLSEHTLCPGRHNDDVRAGGRDAHLDSGVAILGELSGQELVQFRLEDSVSDELKSNGEVMFWFRTHSSKCIEETGWNSLR